MEKITNDPSYVPRVGQFWGHDDRLMDKDLRGMSDWWRGRWQGRGRGRGGRGGFAGRGGGRGGSFGGAESPSTEVPERELEPIDTRWTHDGYEELMKEDTGSRGGRGGRGRGRGWNKDKRGRGRGGSGVASPRPPPTEVQAQLQADAAAKMAKEQQAIAYPTTTAAPSSIAQPTTSTSTPAPAKPTKRAAKAAKHANAKGRLTAVLAEVVKDRETAGASSVVAAAKSEAAAERAVAPSVETPAAAATPSVKVNLPKPQKKKQPVPPPQVQPTTSTQQLPPPVPLDSTHRPSATADQIAISAAARMALDLPPHQSELPSLGSDKERAEAMERAILKDSFRKLSISGAAPSTETAQPSSATSQPPVVLSAPLATQPSTNPSYSYVSLPPGIAMGESGLLYEIATGRPVVLNQPTPPLPPPPVMPVAPPPMAPMYNPRPVMHPQAGRSGSMSFIPSHVITPDYPATPPLYGGYPGSPAPADGTRGTPNFFTPPKSGGRVQIRPPAAKAEEQVPKDAATANHASSYRPPQEQHQYTSYSQPAAPTYQPTPEQYYNSYYSSSVPQTNGYTTAPNGGTEDPYYSSYYGQPPYGYPPVDYSAYTQDGSGYGGSYGAPPPPDASQQQQRQNPAQASYY